MNKKALGIIGVVVVIVLAAGAYFMFRAESTPVTAIEGEAIETVFVSSETGDIAVLSFLGEKTILNYGSFTNTLLQPVRAASGARFESAERNLEVWNKGDELTITEGEEVIFTGRTIEAKPETNSTGEDHSRLRNEAWIWKRTIMSDGTEVAPKNPGTFSITFDDGGRLNGTTDCNGFSADYSIENGVITFGPVMMTKMFCEGSQEMEFQAMLTGPLTYVLSEAGELVLMMPEGAGSVVFELQ